MGTSWVLDAIEREAMARARREIATQPMTFVWMGCSPDQLTWLISDYQKRTGRMASEIVPQAVDGKAP